MERGLSCERNVQKSVCLCKWVYGMYYMNTICDKLKKFNGISWISVSNMLMSEICILKRDDEDIKMT